MATEIQKYERARKAFEIATESIQTIQHNLEMLATNLELNVPSIEAEKFPEYIQAMNAIEKYQLAIKEKERLLNEAIKKE
jgi:hypothetical protein